MAGIPVQDEFEPMGNYYLIRAKYVDVEGVRLDKVINQVKSSIEAIKTDFYTKAESDSKYASKTDVYTKSEVDTALNGKVSAQSGYGLISDADKAQIQTNKAGIAAAETAIAGKASQEEVNTIKSDVAGKASAEAVSQLQTEMDVQKARMDQLVEDPEVGVDEIADARIDNTGKTYANLGDHIRGTETSLKETIENGNKYLSGAINAIADVTASATITENLEVTSVGATVKIDPDNPNRILIFGTPTSTRRVLFLNGQHAEKTTSGSFAKTLDEGEYNVELVINGKNDQTRYPLSLAYTTTTYSGTVTSISKSCMIVTDEPIMLGVSLVYNQNYGTEEDPSTIDIKITRSTAKDDVARGQIEKISEIYSGLYAAVDSVKVTDRTWTQWGVTVTPISESKFKLNGTIDGIRSLCIFNGNATFLTTSQPAPTVLLKGTYTLNYDVVNGNIDVRYAKSGSYTSSGSFKSWNNGETITVDEAISVVLWMVKDTQYNDTEVEMHITKETIVNASEEYVLSSGKGDRTEEIKFALKKYNKCILACGEFVVSGGIDIPKNATLSGYGVNTVVKCENSDVDYIFKLNENAEIKDMCITGSITERPTEIGSFDAIVIRGTGSDSSQRFRCTIDGVVINGFSGCGIKIVGTGYSPQSGCHISNAFIYTCGCGVQLGQFAEFHRLTAVNCNACTIGILNNGGNNVITNCDFSSNIRGIVMDNSDGTMTNNSHGTFTACTVNHTGDNEGVAIECINMGAGEVFSDMQIFYGGIHLKDVTAFQFTSINFGTHTPINIEGGGLICFNNCIFRTVADAPISIVNNNVVKFNNCYSRSGAEISG